MANEVIALCVIGRNDPNETWTHTGDFDERTGEPILKKSVAQVQPGEWFTIDDDIELRELLAMGAVREPTPAEVALREAGQ